jgi:N-hydroxyarylamine O-acetyltransferase
MVAKVDLDAYFQRIHWSGGSDPTLETLAGLIKAHTAHIPFENLDVLLGRTLRLDLEGLQDKMVGAGRGGYCFEHASLFAAVLEALDFQVARHAARVVLFGPLAEAKRDHMFMTVVVGGATYVVDPGFGPYAPPLSGAAGGFVAGSDNTLDAARRKLLGPSRHSGGSTAGGRLGLHAGSGEPYGLRSVQPLRSTHPKSPFVNWIFLSAVTSEGRVNVINRKVTLLRGAAEPTATELADRTALRGLLREHFGFDLPEVESIAVPAIPEWT